MLFPRLLGSREFCRESAPGYGLSAANRPVQAVLSMVLGPDFPSRRLSMGDYRQNFPSYCWPSVLIPFRELDQQELNCICPVDKVDQLLMSNGPLKKGLPVSKQTLSRWIVDAICIAYKPSRLTPPKVCWSPRPSSQVFPFRTSATPGAGSRRSPL